MKNYTTPQRQKHAPKSAREHPLPEEQWEQAVGLVPADLEETAREEKALQRQRKVRSAKDLLRLVLVYSLCDWPLRLVGAWAVIVGIGNLSTVAVRKRLRKSRRWLGRLVATYLLGCHLAQVAPKVRLRIVDATCISRPGSRGTDWRVHLSFNLGHLRLDAVEVTDAHGGESLARYALQPEEIVVGDRYYARGPELVAAAEAASSLVVRVGWLSLALREADGTRFTLLAWLRQVPPAGPVQREIWVEVEGKLYPWQLIACRLPQAAVEQARRKIRRRARRKGHTPRRGTLEAAAFIMVVTNLPADTWRAPQVLELYRIRWQVELAIKRLKSIWHLDHLRAKDPALVQTYLLGKLLGALLGDALTGKVRTCFPAWFGNLFRPLSLWQLQRIWFEWLHRAVVGPISLQRILEALPRLQRYLRDSPRKKRKQQLAHAFDWLQRLNESANQAASLAVPAQVEHKMVLS